YVLSIGFSRVFVNPGEITEQYLKSGDSLLNIHAGKDTRRYLSSMINIISIFSATVMGMCLVVPMVLQLTGNMHSTLAALPSSVLMLTGIWCNLYREVSAIRKLEAYEPFI
ncbi:MAG: preprotein translocase subunit SecY, partial [Agathobacter sp.]|nr:preprotein translocase subunit SecY [Agathobacter sp.]